MSQAADSPVRPKLLSFKADAELVEGLERSARENDRSVSAEIRQAVRQYLEEEGGKE